MFKVELKFKNVPIMGASGKPFAEVIDSRVFYMGGDELAKLQAMVDARDDMLVEVLPYAPTTAKAALAMVEAVVAAQRAKGHY